MILILEAHEDPMRLWSREPVQRSNVVLQYDESHSQFRIVKHRWLDCPPLPDGWIDAQYLTTFIADRPPVKGITALYLNLLLKDDLTGVLKGVRDMLKAHERER